jgi:hypothetical protein
MNEDAYARYVVVKEPDTKNRSLRTARAGVRELTRHTPDPFVLCALGSSVAGAALRPILKDPLDEQSF